MTPDLCPNCGAAVPPHARACPECGSDETTGWSDEANVQKLDLPDDSFDYDEFAKREFGDSTGVRVRPAGIRWTWWIVAITLILLLLLFRFL